MEQLKEKTIGDEALRHGVDQDLMHKLYHYLKASGMGVGGALLEVGAGLGLRTYQLMPFCSSYFSFDADPRMVDIFNTGLLDRRKRYPEVDI